MGEHVVTFGARQCGKTAAMSPPPAAPELPRRLSIDIRSPDYHPSFVRVGVRIDGIERNDIQWYDLDRKEYMTTNKSSHLAETIEPYWRFAESRQQRRARERWEGKRK